MDPDNCGAELKISAEIRRKEYLDTGIISEIKTGGVTRIGVCNGSFRERSRGESV